MDDKPRDPKRRSDTMHDIVSTGRVRARESVYERENLIKRTNGNWARSKRRDLSPAAGRAPQWSDQGPHELCPLAPYFFIFVEIGRLCFARSDFSRTRVPADIDFNVRIQVGCFRWGDVQSWNRRLEDGGRPISKKEGKSGGTRRPVSDRTSADVRCRRKRGKMRVQSVACNNNGPKFAETKRRN